MTSTTTKATTSQLHRNYITTTQAFTSQLHQNYITTTPAFTSKLNAELHQPSTSRHHPPLCANARKCDCKPSTLYSQGKPPLRLSVCLARECATLRQTRRSFPAQLTTRQVRRRRAATSRWTKLPPPVATAVVRARACATPPPRHILTSASVVVVVAAASVAAAVASDTRVRTSHQPRSVWGGKTRHDHSFGGA